jgi:hypothetical protein
MRCEDIQMIHTAEEVEQIFAEAKGRSSRRWVPNGGDNPTAINDAWVQFESSRIGPLVGEIEIEPHIAEMLNVDAGMHSVWFLTAPTKQRVFFDELTGNFGVAWGPDVVTGSYVDLGFRTGDPMDAFLA